MLLPSPFFYPWIRQQSCWRVLLLFLGICYSSQLFGTTYYVSNQGSDQFDGKSIFTPLATLSKAVARLATGDELLLERGSIFYESFSVTTNNITISSYGEGELPIMSNEFTLNGVWRNTSGNFWELKLDKPLSKIFGLYRNGERLTLGRYPEKTLSPYSGFFSRYDRLVGNYLKDTTRLWRTDDFTGAEVAVRPNRWYLEVYKVVDQNDTSLILDANIVEKKFARDLGYFFIHHPKFCDEEGEWGYDTSTGTLYFNSITNPNKSKFTTLGHSNTLEIKKAKNVTVKGIRFEGSGLKSLAVNDAENVLIVDCEFHQGGRAIFVENSSKTEITNCSIQDMYMSGIVLLSSPDAKVMNNNIENIGTLGPIHDNGDQMWHFTGIYSVLGNNNQIEGNRIVHCGYNGINITGANTLVKLNYIDGFNTLIDDGGGIYTHGGNQGSNSVGLVIDQNIVVNSLGNPGGGPQIWGKPHTASSGIYIDDRQSGITVKNNIVAHITHYGIFFKGNTEPPYQSDVVVENNLFYNCEKEFYIDGNFRNLKHYFIGAKVLNNQLWDIDGPVPQNSEANLKFIWINHHKEVMSIKLANEEAFNKTEMKGNKLITIQERPFVYQDQPMTLKEFNQLPVSPSFEMIQLTSSEKEKVKLYINKTKEEKVFLLTDRVNYQDVEGKKHKGSLTLPPFTAKVLMLK